MRLQPLLVMVVVSCGNPPVDPNATAIETTVHLDPGLGIDQVTTSAAIDSFDGPEAFAPGTLPTAPRRLAASETFAVRVAEALDGKRVMLRVDGLVGGNLVASGGAAAMVVAHKITQVDVTLGAPAICGDGIVRDPLEGCDDGNRTAGDGCSPGCFPEADWACTNPPGGKSTCHAATFDVVGAESTGNRKVVVTFSAPPDPTKALELSSYAIPGLTLGGTPLLSGNTVTLATSSQGAIAYDVIVDGVTRASDGKELSNKVMSFAGRSAFDVASAASNGTTRLTVTFDAPPDPTAAIDRTNYSVPGLTVSGTPTLAGNVVTLTTSAQSAQSYAVTVSNVTRASDGEPLATATANFSGQNGFDVAGAASTGNQRLTVTFNAPPNATLATLNGSYALSGNLAVVGTPTLAGNTVTLTTSSQAATTYTVTVSGVTRASDGQPLSINSATFAGTPITPPTVSAVTVVSTAPDNGIVPYNTGTVTVQLTGTQFASVSCPTRVRLDDLDGAGAAVNTQAISCTVNSDTSITATFPAGIRTNGSNGWDVIVTNSAGSNVTSAKLVPVAGLLVSEPFTGSSTAGPTHEFVEVYNPTATAIDVSPTGVGLNLHIRDTTGGDTPKPLSIINKLVPSHGYFLIVSQESTAADAWYAHRDATYTAMTKDLTPGGGVYLSLSANPNASVLDKVGWGAQPAGGYEGAALAEIANDTSAERLPGGVKGHATDTDNNANDFLAPSTMITPSGTIDPAQP